MTTPRILVCGNRDWACKRTIAYWMRIARNTLNIWPPTLIHGACGKKDKDGRVILGADLFAAEIAREWGWNIEPYPADWDANGNAAGPIRNREMADAWPDMGLAFGRLYRGSKLTGTGDMVSVLNARGIPVIVIGEPLQ